MFYDDDRFDDQDNRQSEDNDKEQNEDLNEEEKQVALAHEEGHIWNDHLVKDNILGNDVIPVLESVHSAPGTPLIEKVPAVIMPDKSVGVVHKSGDRLIMESLPVSGFTDPVVQVHQLLRILQIAILLFPRPFSHCVYLLHDHKRQ